jgi:dephospho-CoA kinase
VGVESTIIDMSKTPYRILRAGALSAETVFSALEDAMTVIGVTGGTGSGKTTALEAIREKGGLVVDCDAVYHELLQTDRELLSALDARFPGVIRDGVLDRKALGGIVFADPAALLDLNALTHGAVRREVGRQLRDWAKMGGELAAVDAIALFESGLGDRCTYTMAITAPRERRIERLMRREGISRDYAGKRIDAQKSDTYFAERCDKILVNDGTLESFREQCRAQIAEWTGR